MNVTDETLKTHNFDYRPGIVSVKNNERPKKKKKFAYSVEEQRNVRSNKEKAFDL